MKKLFSLLFVLLTLTGCATNVGRFFGQPDIDGIVWDQLKEGTIRTLADSGKVFITLPRQEPSIQVERISDGASIWVSNCSGEGFIQICRRPVGSDRQRCSSIERFSSELLRLVDFSPKALVDIQCRTSQGFHSWIIGFKDKPEDSLSVIGYSFP